MCGRKDDEGQQGRIGDTGGYVRGGVVAVERVGVTCSGSCRACRCREALPRLRLVTVFWREERGNGMHQASWKAGSGDQGNLANIV